MSNNLPVVINTEETKTLIAMGEKFFVSGLYPNIKNAAGAFAVVQYGKELGVPPMTAMQTMAIVKGKITMMGSMLQTLLIRGGVKIHILESTVKNCTLKFERDGYPSIQTSFSIEDAKRAGLYKEDSGYMKYPEEMLYWRAMAKGGRRIGSDLMLGIYAREEIQDDDSIIDVTPQKSDTTETKKFVSKSHKQDVSEKPKEETPPPINAGLEGGTTAEQNGTKENQEKGLVVEHEVKVQEIPEELLTPDQIKEQLGDAIDPLQDEFDRLMSAIKEVEDSGNKFRWKNWLKKHTPEINALKEKHEVLWKELCKYVAFMNTKKFK